MVTHYLIVDDGELWNACDEEVVLAELHGATFDAFYHVPQGECCMKCSIEWQKEVSKREEA